MSDEKLGAGFLDWMMAGICDKIRQRKADFADRFRHVTGAGMGGGDLLFSSFSPGAAALGRSIGAAQEFERAMRNFDVTLAQLRAAGEDKDVEKKIRFLDAQFKDWRDGLPQALQDYEKVLERRKKRERESIELVRKDWKALTKVLQSPKICLAAVNNNGCALKHCYKVLKTPELCMAAVLNNPLALRYCETKTPELCMAAVQKEGIMLEFCDEQTDALCEAAVREDGLALQFVKNQTPDLCSAAVRENGLALEFVKNQTPDLCSAAVAKNGMALKFVHKQTPVLCEKAVTQNFAALMDVRNQTPEICQKAIDMGSLWALPYIKDKELAKRLGQEQSVI